MCSSSSEFEKCCFLESSTTSESYNLSFFYLDRSLSLEDRGLIDIPFMWVLLLIVTYWEKNPLWWKLSDALNDGHSNMSLDVFLCSFWQINCSRSFPRAYNLSSLRFLASLSVPGTGPSFGVGLKSNQKVVGYSHNVCATIVPVGISCRQVTILVHRDCHRVRLVITLPSQ